MKKTQIFNLLTPFGYILISLVISCSSFESSKEESLYNTYCTMCHIAPSIGDLPKHIWKAQILPDMGARMGIRDPGFNPTEGLSFREIDAINQTGVYPFKPIIPEKDWEVLKNYIINLAPDSLATSPKPNETSELEQFSPKSISLDKAKGSFITFLQYDTLRKKLLLGDISGNLGEYDFKTNKISGLGRFGSAITSYTKRDSIGYVTAVGYLNPSEIPSGKIFKVDSSSISVIPEQLHRPVNTLVVDLNKSGKDELVISEFGNLTGNLTLLSQDNSLPYKKRTLLTQPGAIRVLAKDMDKDGRDDLIVLTSQGDEGIYILYQKDNLNFEVDKVIRFSPLYGNTWFELIDYDGDGDDDIITVNGDNADKSFVKKPYHGLRIHINDGNNQFEEKYFYALNGATRLIANDFDQDGDVDFGVISTFPDYENESEFSFVYLENSNSKTFSFTPYTFEDSKLGRWFLMDYGDVDNDGDMDIVLSSFTYSFTPVPNELSKLWNDENIDLMVLENKLIIKEQ